MRRGREPAIVEFLRDLYLGARVYSLVTCLVVLRQSVRDAKRRDPSWSLRATVRRRASHLAYPLEAAHRALGVRRVHAIERLLGLRD